MSKQEEKGLLGRFGGKTAYQHLERIPVGTASKIITPGCVVVEGGAFRGVYAQGVLDALMVNDLNFQCAIGVSAGALSAMNYLSGQIGRSARVNLKYRHDSRFVSFRDFGKNGGIINFDFLFHDTPEEPWDSARFHEPSRRFVAVATNCLTGQPTFFQGGFCDIEKAARASASMPYFSEMVYMDGMPYLDGGCSMKIPFQWAIDRGYEKIVVIRTRHPDFRYKADKASTLPGKMFRNYPQFAQKLAHMNAQYNWECQQIQELSQQGRIFTIAPSVTWSVGRLEKDMDKLAAWYFQGYQDCVNQLDALKAYLK